MSALRYRLQNHPFLSSTTYGFSSVPLVDGGSHAGTRDESEDSRNGAAAPAAKLVLVSEDEDFCRMARAFLQHSGYDVLLCSTGERAERLLLVREDIEMWMIDVDSLGMQGLFLAKRVRDRDGVVPIVVFAGTGVNDKTLLRILGVAWFRVEKPLAPQKLLAQIHGVLQKRQRRERSGAVPREPAEEPVFETDPAGAPGDWVMAFLRNRSSRGLAN